MVSCHYCYTHFDSTVSIPQRTVTNVTAFECNWYRMHLVNVNYFDLRSQLTKLFKVTKSIDTWYFNVHIQYTNVNQRSKALHGWCCRKMKTTTIQYNTIYFALNCSIITIVTSVTYLIIYFTDKIKLFWINYNSVSILQIHDSITINIINMILIFKNKMSIHVKENCDV